MRLIYAQGFDKHERLEWKPVIFDNIVQSFRAISKAMAELSYEFDSLETEVRIPAVTETPLCHISIPEHGGPINRARCGN